MKIAIISDTHDNMDNIFHIVEILKEKKVDAIFHAGDIVAPFVIKPFYKLNIPIFAVFGNNDGEKHLLRDFTEKTGGGIYPSPYIFNFCGKTILMMHEPYILEKEKDNMNYNLIIYGHTHKYHEEKVNNRWIINPGTSAGYLAKEATFVIYHCESNTIEKIVL